MKNGLTQDIETYEARKEELESAYMGKWVLIHQNILIGTYDSFEEAAGIAVQKFGQGPYLIRQVGAPPVTLSASVMYRIEHA